MNCPSKTEPIVPDGHNQSPNALAADLTTRSDLGKVANARLQREHRLSDPKRPRDDIIPCEMADDRPEGHVRKRSVGGGGQEVGAREDACGGGGGLRGGGGGSQDSRAPVWKKWPREALRLGRNYCKFVGPGFMVAVAYIDPGNYATDVAAGASYRFRLLFMILLSNIFAIFLQSLCINLGTVTGLNLAQMTRAHCPPWLNYISYFFGESAIIATDLAEVIGTAIALSMLSNGKIPLVAGCALSIVDVLFILFFYRQNGASLTARRMFEFFVALLVLGVVICFCIQLSYIQGVTPGEVFRGYVPSSALVQGQGLYQACGILGATVMPHSLYLGSGLVQDRLKDFDRDHNLLSATQRQHLDDSEADSLKDIDIYRPSIQAIKSCRGYSIAECAISLFTFALFVNSAILIVSGAALYDVQGASNASLFGIYDLLNQSLAPAAGKIFAVALLLSGTSAGIVCTIAGQMVSEGQLRLTMKPWKRRLITRSISIVPSIIVAGALGGPGVDQALVGSQVALSVILPFVSAPLVWFTMRSKYMTVTTNLAPPQQQNNERNNDNGNADVEGIGMQDLDSPSSGAAEDRAGSVDAGGCGSGEGGYATEGKVNMRSHPVTSFLAIVIWGIIVIMNVALLVLLGLGET